MPTLSWSKLVTLICTSIKAGYNLTKGLFFINIDGFTATGKSSLAIAISSELNKIDFATEVLSTDDFIRFSRGEIDVSMKDFLNHKNWYDLQRLSAIIFDIRRSVPVDFVLNNLYDHVTGLLNASKKISIDTGSIIIIEGMYAMELDLAPAYRIVLVAQHEELQKRVLERASARGVARSIAKERYWVHNGAIYQSSLAAAITGADLIVDTTDMTRPEIVALKNDPQEKYVYILDRYMQQRFDEL